MSSATVIFISTLLSIPITFTLNYYQNYLTPNIVCGIGVAVLGFMMLMVYLFRHKEVGVDPLYYVFSICCMSSVVDLLIGLENDTHIMGFMHFYLEKGEPYLKTAHGTMICYWDGVVHYGLYLTMLAAMSWGQPFRYIGLFWCGSIINSLVVFLPGNFIGKHAVKTSVLLNIPFVLVPLYGLWRFLHFPKNDFQLSKGEVKCYHVALWRRPVDVILFLWTLGCMAAALFRGCVALSFSKTDFLVTNYTTFVEPYIMDPVAYPRLQMVAYMFYFVPFYILCCYALLMPCQMWIFDIVTFFAGALAQGQFSYMGAALHSRTPYIYRAASLNDTSAFWAINIFVMAHLFILSSRIFYSPEYFYGESDRQVKSGVSRRRSFLSEKNPSMLKTE